MTDYRQELLPPEWRNLVLNPGGEATSLGSSYTATNGVVRTGVTAGGEVPAPVSGTGVVEYEVTASTSQSYEFGPLGPLEPVHRGAFKIPAADTVSARVSTRASTALWVEVQASWLAEVWENGEPAGVQEVSRTIILSATAIDNTGWTTLEVPANPADMAAGATHWRPMVVAYAADPAVDPAPPVIGTKVWADEFIVTDSGADLTGIQYGDGSVAGWQWEDEPNYSSSRTNPAPVTQVETNELTNPSFENDTNGWAFAPEVTATIEANGGEPGSAGAMALRVEATSTKVAGTGIGVGWTTAVSCEPDTPVSFGYMARRATPNWPATTYALLRFYDSEGTALLDELSEGASTLAGSPAEYNEASISGVAPADTATVRGFIWVDQDIPAGEACRFDRAILTKTSGTTYFDGDSEDSPGYTHEWVADAHQSASIQRRKDNGLVERTNLYTNPSFEDTAGPVTLAENLFIDPSFESGIGNWNGSGTAVADSTHVRSGLQAVKVDLSQGQQSLTVASSLPGATTYTLITHVWVPAEETGNPVIRVGGSGVASYDGGAITERDQWVECREVFTTDADGGSLSIYPAYQANGVIWVDDVALVEGAYTGPFFSGDTDSDGTYAYGWADIPYTSTSLRIGQTFPGWDYGDSDPPIASTEHVASGTQAAYFNKADGTGAYMGWDICTDLLTEGAGDYTLSARVWIPSTASNPHLRAVGGGLTTTLAETDLRDQWATATTTFTWDGAGSFVIYAYGANAGDEMWVDSLVIVSGAEPAIYFDGDSEDTNPVAHAWVDTPHASASTRTTVIEGIPTGEVPEATGLDAIEDDFEPEESPDPETDVTASDPLPPPPEAPPAEVDDPGYQSPDARPPFRVAEDTIGRQRDARHIHLHEDVQLGELVMNRMDEHGVVWLVSDIDGWWTTPDPEVPDVSRGWFDGSYETRGRYTARAFTVTGSFIPRHPGDVDHARDTLIRALNLVHRGGWFMTHEDPKEMTKTKGSKVWLVGQPLINTAGLNGKTDFSIALRAPDPVKQGIKDGVPPGYNSMKLLTSSSQYPERDYPKTYPWAYPEAVFGSTVGQVVNAGNAIVWPILRLAGPTNGALKVYNADTGQEFRIAKKLYPGEVLEIDCFTKQVTLNGAGNHRFYLDVDVDWLMLQPGPNKIFFSEEVLGGIRTELEILWRSGWIG